MCGSFIHFKVYGRGSGKDCRLHVQRLNEMRMKQEGHGCQKFPFQEECNEDPAAVHCILEEKPVYNREFMCLIETKFVIVCGSFELLIQDKSGMFISYNLYRFNDTGSILWLLLLSFSVRT